MNASRLQSLVMAVPFRPFRVHLKDGPRYRVDFQWQVATAPNSPTFVFFATTVDDDTEHLISYRDVSEVVIDAPSVTEVDR